MTRRVLITGGSRGLGAAIAEAAARRGWTNLLVGRNEAAMQERVQEWERARPGRGGGCLGLDLNAPDALARLTAWLDKVGDPDIVIHNAAVGHFGPFAETSLGNHEATVGLGVGVTVALTHALIPRLAARPGSHLVYVGSTSGRKPVPYMTVYSSTKAFVHSFALALREELAGTPKVLLVIPGAVQTDFPRLAGLPESFAAKGLTPAAAGEMIAQAVSQGRDGVLTIGSAGERYGGLLQRLFPPTFWARTMRKAYAPLLRRS
jgi:short-subunit dehydrogenase